MLSILSKSKYVSKSKRNYGLLEPIVNTLTDIPSLIALSTLVGTSAIIANRYLVAGPDQYLVRTGLFVKDIKIGKQGFLYPFQKYEFINMHPKSYTFDLHSMSSEKLEFLLPGVFTIGPRNDPESLIKYVRVLAGMSKNQNGSDIVDECTKLLKGMDREKNSDAITKCTNLLSRINVATDKDTITDIILGILEGTTRILSSQMSIEDIFNNRKIFKEHVIANCQEELNELGLYIYNANIKELQDIKGSNYFANMRQKKLSEAENKAKIDIAEANKIGNIGHKQRETETRMQIALLEADTVLKENEMKQKIELSKAEVSVTESIAKQKTEIAKIESINNSRMRETEMQQQVEQKRIVMETEKLRATEMSKACVTAESIVKETDGKATAIKIQAEADLFAKQMEADGMEKLLKTFGGDHTAMIQYLMISKGIYEKLAITNADGIKGLNPKITVWNTNGNTTDSNDYTNVISNILKMLPPVLTTIHEQTGIKLSDNIVTMPKIKSTSE